jgi:hypothetical protein
LQPICALCWVRMRIQGGNYETGNFGIDGWGNV